MRTVALLSAMAVGAVTLTSPAALGSNPATATLAVSPSAAGAKPVVVTISLRTELQCGRLVGGSLVVTFPRQMRVPRAIGAAAVHVGTMAARSVAVAGRVVRVAVPLPRGVICDSIVPGVAKLTFLRAAGIGNPTSPGTYFFTLRRGAETFGSPFRIN